MRGRYGKPVRMLAWAVVASSWIAAPTLWAGASGEPNTPPSGDRAPGRAGRIGFLVAAPDRGFQGNEEVGELVEAFAAGARAAALLVVTDERTGAELASACASLRGTAGTGGSSAGLDEVVVLPLFLSRAERGFQLLERLVNDAGRCGVRGERERDGPRLRLASPFGESYYAVELLADRLREVSQPGGKVLQVVAAGADNDHAAALQADVQLLAELAAGGFGFARVDARVVGTDDRGALEPADVVVPFAMAQKLDGMMSFAASLRGRLPAGAELVGRDLTPDPLIGLWLEREARFSSLASDAEVGVVVLAHGADHHWNEAMRRAVAPLAARHLVEPVFSMADAALVERGVRKLEARGAQAVVVVRVFGLASSFAGAVEHMLGLDVDGVGARAEAAAGDSPSHHAAHGAGNRSATTAAADRHVAQGSAGSHGGHGGTSAHGHDAAAPRPRIRTALPVATVGGLEDHRLFAQALLDRARALSSEAARETVILTAHGAGDDTTDRHWHRLLESLASSMREHGGGSFRAIRGATWREDWPAQREAAVRGLRALVEEATRDGGRALVIPARTLGTGPERRYLEGLDFELGEGFAGHPLFVRWLEEQVAAGVERLRGSAPPAPAAARGTAR